MADRSGDVDVVRSVGNPLLDEEALEENMLPVNGGDGSNDGGGGGGGDSGRGGDGGDLLAVDAGEEDADLPQCKIKRNYSCNLCPFFSQNPRSFLYHSRDVHFDRIKIFECSQCLYASKHSQKLQRHINMIHVAGKNKVKRTSKVTKLERKKEVKTVKRKGEDSASEKSSEGCEGGSPILEVPPQTVAKTADDTDHEDLAFDGEYKCSMCNFRNKNLKLIRRHEKIVHLKKRFLRCGKCSYVTHVKARYTKHVKYHSMPMIKCDLCDFRTPYKWNLDRHYKNHCGTGAFECSKCNFRADIKQSLTVHEMNHHVPPVGQGAIATRKKNKVGASDSKGPEDQAPEGPNAPPPTGSLSREEADQEVEDEEGEDKDGHVLVNSLFENVRNVKVPYSNRRESANNSHLQTDFIHPDDVVPRYGQIYVKNLKCKFCSYKAVFAHEIWRHEKRIHGFIRAENKKERGPKRPPPKLIPIQNKAGSNGIGSPILKIPALNKFGGADADNGLPTATGIPPPAIENSTPEKSVNEKEFNEMCKKSSLTSSLKDFVSLIGDEEGLKTIPDSSRNDLDVQGWENEVRRPELPPREPLLENHAQMDLLKKKNASFFDKLKEKLLLTGSKQEQNLFCEFCGHESKCLSEAIGHQKRHSESGTSRNGSSGPQENEIVLSGAELSSTRCQHCRQRCKTSADLFVHLKSCKAFEQVAQEPQAQPECNPVKAEELSGEDCSEKLEASEDSMENRVFVWNDIGPRLDEEEEREAMALEIDSGDEYSLEDSALYGAVTSKGSDNTESGTLVMEIDPRLNLTVKKVFKCPHCSFWASTASRFHVHIVGHLNKKPFECSLCLYRSNWRWDITKHIRLKSARDPGHLEAQVNMTDETGRRNYSKYNKYLTMMKVQEASAESSGTGRRSKPGEATQGNVTERDIIPLPAPPRLTRAPTPGAAQQVPYGVPLRPPPPLKAAHQVSTPAKLNSPPDKPPKKTQWKCKKCHFRDSCKTKVLIHVKGHYGKKFQHSDPEKVSLSCNDSEEGGPIEKVRQFGFTSKPSMRTPTYKCGHCQQVSNWKHVIQRHCRLKHNGDAFIQVGWTEEPPQQPNLPLHKQENLETSEDSTDIISCDICPFTTDTEGDLTAHKLNHVDRPGSIFKCSYCPFYVPSKIAVLEHMEIHGVTEGCDMASLKVDNFDPSECNQNFTMGKDEDREETRKRYKCRQCPYLSNSRTQFLYHKQFHRPRDAPFKCMYCSYNVSRRHLLHQHLRVHHREKESRTKDGGRASDTSTGTGSVARAGDTDEIPLVWVSKAGSFHKMFKCRSCPHVSARKINIQDHEKMHRAREDKSETVEERTLGLKFQCPDCNYTCNSAGVLASHVKVHQGLYGEIRCLIDPTKPETDQIREHQNGLTLIEPEVVIKVEQDALGDERIKTPNDSKQEKQEEEGKRPFEHDLEDDDLISSHPENAYSQSSNRDLNSEPDEDGKKVVNFCTKCPARFLFKKELRIHCKFHMIHLPFRCPHCTYTARQRPHLLAHYRVHTEEYQEKTTALLAAYPASPDWPRPETRVVEGRVWTVHPAAAEPDGPAGAQVPRPKPAAKHACHLCPARFFKSVALQYHLTLHGGDHPHKCSYCDYAVKTYGNLIKHQVVHEGGAKTKPSNFSYEFPLHQKFSRVDVPPAKEDTSERPSDPQFGTLMHGSPHFIYPTYLKNGKIKEKRYKCHKCPSAFEKRDQYRIHLSLHGSKQKYKCENCDYSVKYYANYVQHMRKHQTHDEALKARNSLRASTDLGPGDRPNSGDPVSPPSQKSPLPPTAPPLDRRKPHDSKEDKRLYECRLCPYASVRRDALDGHARRHFRVSNRKSAFECSFCDYSAGQGNFLRTHSKLHFAQGTRFKAEAFWKCDNLELWCCEDTDAAPATCDPSPEGNGSRPPPANVLIFQDRGKGAQIRFHPPANRDLFDTQDDPHQTKTYVDVETWDLLEPNPSPSHGLQPPTEATSSRSPDNPHHPSDPQKPPPKPSPNTSRGKNWKCTKCPHAFSKKDQYQRHMALHGSNQKYNCDVCDYSVKFYTNYVQHMRMHQTHRPYNLPCSQTQMPDHLHAGEEQEDNDQHDGKQQEEGSPDPPWPKPQHPAHSTDSSRCSRGT